MKSLRLGIYALAIAGALGGISEALAQSRPSTTNMTCAQAQAMVKSAGVIVLGTSGQAYDRFVANEGHCTFQEIGVPTWAPTRDVAQCFVGYVCESRAGRDPTPP